MPNEDEKVEMYSKPSRWFFLASFLMAGVSFFIAVFLIVPLYDAGLFLDIYDDVAKYAEPAGIGLTGGWAITVLWGLLVYGRHGASLLIGAPFALTLPAFVAVLGYYCFRGACL
jgi:hypothetical protein